jgi:crossover junction endonuclease MUS81
MYLLIDYREHDFIKRLSEACQPTDDVCLIDDQSIDQTKNIENDIIIKCKVHNVDVSFKITSLPVADFIIVSDVNDMNSIRIAIERKSIKDLCSSITDGRFREQKTRLIESIKDPEKICYLIEGAKHIPNHDYSLSHTIINGSLLNLIFKHHYHLIQTENKQDTFNMVLLLYKKLQNKDFESVERQDSCVKLLKRSDKITDNKLLHQLCLIPGVSQRTAEVIINYPINSVKHLVDTYNSLLTDKEKECFFANIPITSGNKSRKLGPALSKKIYEYFCK